MSARMWSFLVVTLSIGSLLVGCGGQGAQAPAEKPAAQEHETPAEQPAAQSAAFACPMHAEETSDAPAKCSKCGMDMVPRDGANP